MRVVGTHEAKYIASVAVNQAKGEQTVSHQSPSPPTYVLMCVLPPCLGWWWQCCSASAVVCMTVAHPPNGKVVQTQTPHWEVVQYTPCRALVKR